MVQQEHIAKWSFRNVLSSAAVSVLVIATIVGTLACVTWIWQDSETANEYLSAYASVVALSSVGLTTVQWSINRQNRKSIVGERTAIEESQKLFLETMCRRLESFTESLVDIRHQHPSSPYSSNDAILSTVIQSMLKEVEDLQHRIDSIQNVLVWLHDKDELRRITKQAVQAVYSEATTSNSIFRPVFFRITTSKQQRKIAYQNVFDCLMWIRRSFRSGDFLTTEQLLSSRLNQPNLAIEALIWIKSVVITKTLDEKSQQEIVLYFDELIDRIRQNQLSEAID